MGHQTSAEWGKQAIFEQNEYHSPDGADGCCITSNKWR